jgi:hypothetical protein
VEIWVLHTIQSSFSWIPSCMQRLLTGHKCKLHSVYMTKHIVQSFSLTRD